MIVKYKVVAALLVGKRAERFGGVGAVAGVVLGEMLPEEEVLHEGEKSVGDVLIARHTPPEAAAAEYAGGECHIVESRC